MAPDGSVIFSDVCADRLYRLDLDGELEMLRGPGNYPRGTALDVAGWLFVCEAGDAHRGLPPRVIRMHLSTGRFEVLADVLSDADGDLLQAPSHLSIDSTGRVWFSDGPRPSFLPRWWPQVSGGPERAEHAGVYRIDPDGVLRRVLQPPEVHVPHGVAVTPDGRRLYVVDNDPSHDGSSRLLSFFVAPDGAVADRHVLREFPSGGGGDGVAADVDGGVIVTVGPNHPRGTAESPTQPSGLQAYGSDGRARWFLPVPEDPITGVCLDPRDPSLLYTTAGPFLYRLRRP